MGKSKAHQIYKLKDGTRVPGTTTITSILDKPALKFWANNLGLKGISVSKYVDNLADIGTLCHKMVENYLKKEESLLGDFLLEREHPFQDPGLLIHILIVVLEFRLELSIWIERVYPVLIHSEHLEKVIKGIIGGNHISGSFRIAVGLF